MNSKMKRLIASLLCLVTLSSLIACNKQNTNPADTTNGDTTGEDYDIYSDPNWVGDGINFIDCDTEWSIKYLPVGASQVSIDTCSKDLKTRYANATTVKEKMEIQAEAYFEKMTDGTTITDMSFCVFQQTSVVESSYADWIIKETAEDVKNGVSLSKEMQQVADSRNSTIPYRRNQYATFYDDLVENDLDWAEIAVEKCAESGIRPWLYFRMNDMHFIDYQTSPWHDSFFYTAQENGWLIGEKGYGQPVGTSGNIKNLYDFAHPEVREWYLKYMEEVIMRYDTFGYGLDFMRNIYCFDYLNEENCQEYMNDFIRKVAAIITKAEEKFGHDIKLLVRIAHTPEDNYLYGYDVKTWAKEGLVDVIVASCEEVCNSNVDVDEWKEALGEDVALLIGFDDHIIRWQGEESKKVYHTTEDQIKGLAASYFARGADGVYFNNYYSPQTGSGAAVTLARSANRSKASRGIRSLVVTIQDISPKNNPAVNPLPTLVVGEDGKGADFNLNIGKIEEKEYVYVFVGYTKVESFDAKLTLDGKEPVEVKEIEIDPYVLAGHYFSGNNFRSAHKLVRYCFEKVPKQTGDSEMLLHFEGKNQETKIVYLELSVRPLKIK